MATTIDPMNITTTQPQYLLSTYYDKRLLERLVPKPVMYQHGTKKSLPKGEGKTVKWSRYVNLGDAGLLTEGTRPTALVISAVNVTATLEQLGDYLAVSDFVEMTAISSVVEGAIDVFADQASNSIDKYVRNALFGEKTGYSGRGTNYSTRRISAWVRSGGVTAGSVSALSALRGKTLGFYMDFVNSLSSGVTKNLSGCNNATALATSAWNKYRLAVKDIREAVEYLKLNAVPTFDDGYYIGFIHPTAATGLRTDSEWQSWSQYSGELTKMTMHKGEIGEVERVRFVESPLVLKHPLGKGCNISACFTTIVGKDAFGVVDYDGGTHVYVKQPNQYDTSNPLNQWTTIGWKVTMASRILNASSGIHIMSIN